VLSISAAGIIEAISIIITDDVPRNSLTLYKVGLIEETEVDVTGTGMPHKYGRSIGVFYYCLYNDKNGAH